MGTDPIFRYGAVPGVAGLETLEAHDLRLQYDRHFHDTYAFGIVLRGVERCRVGREVNFFEPDTVPMFNPGEVHDGGPATARRDPLALQRARQLFDAIDCGSALGVEEALALALETLLGQRTEHAKPPEALKRVRELIDAECCEPLRLRDLCTLAGVSSTRLLRTFAHAYGLTPHRYQQSRRVAKAKKMIVEGALLADIATACGYADQSHLNRWFLRIHGTTPGRYRRNFLQDRCPTGR